LSDGSADEEALSIQNKKHASPRSARNADD